MTKLLNSVEEYVALRRATGFKFRDPERLLSNFAAFASARGEEHVRAEAAVEWAHQAKSQLSRHRRLRLVTRLAEYLRADDLLHEIPPQGVFCVRVVRQAPHFFSEADVANIVARASLLPPPDSLRPKTFSTIFGLIAVAGLRISETIELLLKDFTDGGVLIRATKFRKSRFLPLHETTLAAITRYLSVRRSVATESDHLFISLRGGKLSPHTVRTAFRDLCQQAGIGSTAAGTRPRVHDLRHSFAVRSLENCPTGRDHVNRHMVALATYMGHADVASTYWYLECTPRLLRDVASACESMVKGTLS